MEIWKTCRQMQVKCKGCGKMDSCTVSPDLTAFKCWREGGRVVVERDYVGFNAPTRLKHETLQDAARNFPRAF